MAPRRWAPLDVWEWGPHFDAAKARQEMTVDLFSRAASRDRRGQPLAERMRPRTLAEFVGQEHVLGPGKLLRRVLDTKE